MNNLMDPPQSLSPEIPIHYLARKEEKGEKKRK